MIKGLIFDKDGTLFDFNATWGEWARGMLEAETAQTPHKFAPLAEAMGYDTTTNQFRPDSVVIAATAGETAECIRSVLPELDPDALLERMNAMASLVAQVEVVPLIAYFTALKASGLRLGIATNDAEAPALSHLERAGVSELFDFIAGYDSGFGGKPAIGQLIGFCDHTGLLPSDCAMIGDSTHDLHAGRAAGMTTIGVLTGPAPREELAPFADVVLSHIGEIPDWMHSENLAAH